ncbi:MAG: hypothetical protein U0P48_12750 [Ancrocorticia sp.]
MIILTRAKEDPHVIHNRRPGELNADRRGRTPSHNKLVNSGGHTPRHAPVAVKYRDHSLSTIRPARENGTTQSSCAGAAFHYETSLVDSLI